MSVHLFNLAAIGAALPVATAQTELTPAIAGGVAVITAPPGTGKTTFVPPLVANLLAGIGVGGRVLLSQPRRVAVRAAARRIAALDGSAVGGPVGFTVRGERQVSPETRIEVLTPGVLLRHLLADPELTGVSAVILDEVHERSVDGDLLLGFLTEARELREDLVVIAMSATLDAQGLSTLLSAPVVNVPSPLHPLEIAYAPGQGSRLNEHGVTRDFLHHVADLAVREQRASSHDALVFVPGAREVDAVVQYARDQLAPGSVEVLPLHGRLSSEEQDRAVSGSAPGSPARIVVSTGLAESSLTVPGVRLVIDAGLTREVRRDRGRDMAGLVTLSASRASVEQRAGRAARQGPGRAVRAYSEPEFARMPAAAAPEILSADLLDAALLLAAWGTPGGAGLRLLTAPPATAIAQAVRDLNALGLADEAGALTVLGRRVARLPVGVREARALLSGTAEIGDPVAVAEIVAAISGDFRDPDADLSALLRDLRQGRAPGSHRWRAEVRRLTKIAEPEVGAAERSGTASGRSNPEANTPGIVTAIARPEWIARRTGEHSRSYLLASGTRAALPESSPLTAQEWLAIREVQRVDGRIADGTGAVIRLAAALSEAEALRIGDPLRKTERLARVAEGRVRVQERRMLGAIVLSATPVSAIAADTTPAFAAHLREVGIAALRWSQAATTLRSRLGLLHRELGDPWPAVDDATLLESIQDWLGPELERLKPGSSLHGIDVTSALRRLLPWPEAAQLDALVPEHLAVPSGSRVRIQYPDPGSFAGGSSGDNVGDDNAADTGERPIVAVKLQELFGLADTPRLVGGRVPVLFHLLSPARKPLAITGDLASFWNGPYQDVRKQMRGRYPKHPWPEDPWSAEATALTKRAAAARRS